MNENIKKRKSWIDVSKGILILLVVYSHLCVYGIQITPNNGGGESCNLLCVLFRCFYMQAFFILSGYTTNLYKQFKPFFITNIKTILLPCIVFSIFDCLLSSIIYNDNSILNNMAKLRYWYMCGESYWFLVALFECRIIMWLLHKIADNIKAGIIIVVLFIYGVTADNLNDNDALMYNYFYYRHTFAMLPFMWIGTILKSYNMQSLLSNRYLKIIELASVLFFPIIISILVIFHIHIPSHAINTSVTLMNMPLHVLLTLSGSACLVIISKKISKCKILEFLGRNSLVIYLTHFIILQYLFIRSKQLITSDIGIIAGVFYMLIIYFIALTLCMIVTQIISKPPLKVILGKF